MKFEEASDSISLSENPGKFYRQSFKVEGLRTLRLTESGAAGDVLVLEQVNNYSSSLKGLTISIRDTAGHVKVQFFYPALPLLSIQAWVDFEA